jgi:hypothetical protein
MTLLILILIMAGVFCVLVLGLKLFALMSGWDTLRNTFPSQPYGTVIARYKRGILRTGRIVFERAPLGRGRVTLTDQGFILHMSNPFMSDVLISFERVVRMRAISIPFRKHRVIIDIDHTLPLNLILPEEALVHLEGRIKEKVLKEIEGIDSISELIDFTMEIHTPRPRAKKRK